MSFFIPQAVIDQRERYREMEKRWNVQYVKQKDGRVARFSTNPTTGITSYHFDEPDPFWCDKPGNRH